MKKTLLTLAVAASAMTAHAFGPAPRVAITSDGTFHSTPFVAAAAAEAPAKAPSRATGSVNYTFAQEPFTALGNNSQKAGDTEGMAFQFTPAEASKFAGSTVSAFSFYTGTAVNDEGQPIGNNITEATIFMTTDLQKDPFYTQKVTGLDNTPFKQYNVPLTTPYTIEASKGFYIGVTFTLATDNDLVIVVDGEPTNTTYGGWAGLQGSNGSMSWQNIAQSYGSMCIGATITGNLPENELNVDDSYVDCVVEAGKEFSMEILVTNNACNDINTVGFTVKVGDNTESNTVTLSEPLRYKSSNVLTLSGLRYDAASRTPVPVTVTLDKVNGQPNNSKSNTATGEVTVIPAGKGYVRNVVIEEMTGNWCGYCPAGMVTMEAIREQYTDGTLIPVAIHVNGNKRDPMYTSSWANVASLGGGGVPSAIVNRMMTTYPQSLDYVINSYRMIHAIPALASVTATARFSDENPRQIIVDSKTSFVFDMTDANTNFRLCYGITEDGVGPYTQTNYYSGSGEDVGGWEDKPEEVEGTIYNDVARQLISYRGIIGSVPAEITAGAENAYTYTVTLDAKVKPQNANLIVYLINTKSGIIENAWYIPSSKISAGIDDIITDSADAPVEIYNLNGVKLGDSLDGLAPGIYIVRQGGKTTKVAVR